MSAVQEAEVALEVARREYAEANARADQLQEKLLLELIRWLPTWWLATARMEVVERTATAQQLGQEVISTLRREVEALAGRSEDVIRLSVGQRQDLFPHLAGVEGVKDARAATSAGTALPADVLTPPLGGLLVRHHLIPATYDPLQRWRDNCWVAFGSSRRFQGDEAVQEATTAYRRYLGLWAMSAAKVPAAETRLEQAKAADLWGP